MRSAPTRAAASSLLVLTLLSLPLSQGLATSYASIHAETTGGRSEWLAPDNLGTFVRKLVDGEAVCVEADLDQTQGIRNRDPNLPVIALESVPSLDKPGMRIILRGTSQLREFPLAIEAFKRAAAGWEAVIQNRITIVIDVDFGPTLFGKPFGDNVAGSTDSQVIRGNVLYPSIRAGLISRASSPQKKSLLESLPSGALQTDIGESTGIAATSAALRAVELISLEADPKVELTSFGLPPAIGMSSKFSFDFERADGVAQDTLDFESIVSHEIGHILGLISCVGQQQMNSSMDIECSIWDLFRGRPDAIKSSFATAQRILNFGGEQAFFAGDEPIPLATGRPDGTGADGGHPAHWKDDRLGIEYIGVMDPTIRQGETHLITDNDTAALDAIGYRANRVTQSAFLTPLFSGRSEPGFMVRPPANLGFLSHLQYSIAVPPGASQLRIELNGNQDVDLFVRFGARVFIQGFHPEGDHVSAGDSGFEVLTITSSSSPPLRAGTYFIAVANFGPGDADFTVTATVAAGVDTRAPALFSIHPRLEGDLLNLTYTATDPDRDVMQADITILDEGGRPLGQPSSFVIGSANSIRIESHLSVSGLSLIPTAMSAAIVLVDSVGNRSPEATVDFSRAEPGGLTLKSASLDGSRLTMKTSGLAESLEVEINGHVVAPPRSIKIKGSGAKLIVKGDAAQLGLHRGANRIRLRNSLGWSNIFIFAN